MYKYFGVLTIALLLMFSLGLLLVPVANAQLYGGSGPPTMRENEPEPDPDVGSIVPKLKYDEKTGTVVEGDDVIFIGNPLSPNFESGTQMSGGTGGDVVGYFQGRLAGLLNVMFGALAVLSLIPVVFGGIQLITSQGSSEKVEKGKKSLFWGVAGLVLAFSAIVVFNFLLRVILPEQQ